MRYHNRRAFLKRAGAAVAGGGLASWASSARAQATTTQVAETEGAGERAEQDSRVKVLYPRGRVPLSFIIDDSTCLVNMGHFCMPQFATAWPSRDIYKKPWKTWPREIPDAFVREFGEWCAEHGVKGKYSIVPYPACVGWLDRELPGWSRGELLDSLKLVRELMLPNWDIHPEMITHTRVIDLDTGRPLREISAATMENSYPRTQQSVDELAAYLAYALRILKNCDLPCEGITTPGGFGSLVRSELSLAVQEAVRDVYGVELPHYFKYVSDGDESTEPKLEHVRGLGTDDLRLTVNVPAGTGDWFGGWDGDRQPEGFRYANQDATSGRMVELIEQGRPALMLCHWPGMYTHGTKAGFEDFQRVVLALAARFGEQTIWMKLSEIARYWAAKQLTTIAYDDGAVILDAPFASPNFTLQVNGRGPSPPQLTCGGRVTALRAVSQRSQLQSGTWLRDQQETLVCFDLPQGRSELRLRP
jgi:hypothetical protein